jgi:hypothetical protein
MAKRFTDTNKYKKPFIRGLQGAYKLFWDYLYHECDHAGIWIVDFEIAQLYLGHDMPINKKDALKYFNEGEIRIIEIDNGKKWFIKPFIDFQYGELNEQNRAHNSVITILKKYNLFHKPLRRSLQAPTEGAMDKDKDMDMVKDMDLDPKFFAVFLQWLRYKRKKGESYKSKESTQIAYNKLLNISKNDPKIAIQIIENSMASNYSGFFEPKDSRRPEVNPEEIKIIQRTLQPGQR